MLQKGFLNICGAIEMLAGLEYHHGNILRICVNLSEGIRLDEKAIDHEAVAYVNRMGQYHAFAKSLFVRQAIADADLLIPTIVKFMVFRNKHAAHRSIDTPHKEDEHTREMHARALTSAFGAMFSPKPGVSVPMPKISDYASLERWRVESWKTNYRTFYILDPTTNRNVSLTIEIDHKQIAGEAYSLVEKLILHQ